MSKHLFGLVVTPHGIAANNRGDSEGSNITPLQKILWNGEQHTTVSAEAIRMGIRRYWQATKGENELNRRWKDEEKPLHVWADHEFKDWGRFIDDDVLGFMSADAAKEETNEEEQDQGAGKRKKKRGTATIRRGRLEVTRAISLIPFGGDITFNAAGVGATPSASSTGEHPVPYGTEVHATRYQYGFALTPEALRMPSRALDVVDAVTSLSEVAGNHSRFLYDFSPDAVIYRWTDDFAPRMLYGFALADNQRLTLPEIMGRIGYGDIDPKEMIVGASTPESFDPETMGRFEKLGIKVQGVKAAAQELKVRMRADLKLGG